MRRSLAWLAAVLVAAVPAGVLTAPASAHGDPASEYLVDHEVFFPLYARLSEEERLKLAVLVREANAKGFPVRLALIATRRDLGTEGDAWLKPRAYAIALDEDLAYYYKGRVLVAMPSGFGLVYPQHEVAQASRLLARIRPGATPAALAAAAATAIERLAASEGVRVVPPAHVTTPAQQNRHDRIVIVIAALAALALWWAARLLARLRRPLRGSGEASRKSDGASASRPGP